MGTHHYCQPGWHKQLINENPEYLYKYKVHVPLGTLGMMDDIVGVSENGVHATQLNAFVNIKTAEKKLQFWHNKCNTKKNVHKIVRYVRTDLFIDHLSEQHDENDELNKNMKSIHNNWDLNL